MCMHQISKAEDSGLSPSFSCYTSDSSTSMAVARVIHEEEDDQGIEGEEFEFSFNEVNSRGWTVPLNDIMVDRDGKSKQEEYSSCSSSEEEADDLENLPSGTFCVWRPKVSSGSSAKCKKSSSTGGSGSKKWIGIRYLLRRSNSEGKDPMALLTPKRKLISGDQASRLKGKKPVHERFYVQKRQENEIVKRKTYLPYRQHLVGLFASF